MGEITAMLYFFHILVCWKSLRLDRPPSLFFVCAFILLCLFCCCLLFVVLGLAFVVVVFVFLVVLDNRDWQV